MTSSSIVIKVKYGETLRRFNASINDTKLSLDIVVLKEKIRNLFSFGSDVEFILIYVDEDGDSVTLADDNDLHDVVKQSLNPLRITVKLNNGNPNWSSGTSTPIRSLNSGVAEFLKSVPEPLREAIAKLQHELASKASSSAPAVVDLVEKMKSVYLNQISASMASPNVNAESSNSKKKEKQAEKASEGPTNVDLNVPYPEYESFQPPNTTNECPFSGIPLPNVNESDSQGYNRHSRTRHWKRHGLDNNGVGIIFHRGVICDGCGVHPITGPRYKSKVKDDYDLCSVCFAGNANVADYIRIDRPANAFRHHSLRTGFKIPGSKLDSRFILDVNVLDGTMMAPLTRFTKIWRMRNNGSTIWPHGSQLHWIGGDRLSNSHTVDVEIPADGLPVDKELDVAVDFTAPELPGRYVSYWRMASPSGQKFGQRIWVLIQVDASMKDLGETSINLNLPPVTGTMTSAGPPFFSTSEVETALASLPTGPTVSSGFYPTVELDSCLLEPISYPTVDFSVMPPVVDSGPPSPVVQLSGSGSGSQDDQEVGLMKDLEDMGFKQMDLNKEVLRRNNYDLEKSIEALCDVSEWDPMLDELQEMGFEDNEANMRLLKKNNGSIKRVVMDLINGENA